MNLAYSIFFCFFIFSTINSQSVNGRFVELINNSTDFEVKVQLNANSSGLQLGTSTLIFNFNSSGLFFPNPPEYGLDYTFHNYNSETNNSYDSATVTLVGANSIYINIDLIVSNSGELIAESPNWSDIVTIKFSTIDPNQSAGLSWVNSNIEPPSNEIFAGDNLTLLSEFSFEGLNSALPVELVTFSSTKSENSISLYWETATEFNNFGFEVERATKLRKNEWKVIGFVEGAGNSNSSNSYTFIDSFPQGSSKFIYRLRQIDMDGSFKYSDNVEVELSPLDYVLYQNFPNPFNPTTNIFFSLPNEERVIIKIYNVLGKEVSTLFNEVKSSGNHSIVFDGSSLAGGVYFYSIEAGKFTSTKKLLLLK